MLQTGMRSFRRGDVAASVKEFDEAMRLDPELRPYLWQRGLSLFYAGRLPAHLYSGCATFWCQASCPNRQARPWCLTSTAVGLGILIHQSLCACCMLSWHLASYSYLLWQSGIYEEESHMVTRVPQCRCRAI